MREPVQNSSFGKTTWKKSNVTWVEVEREQPSGASASVQVSTIRSEQLELSGVSLASQAFRSWRSIQMSLLSLQGDSFAESKHDMGLLIGEGFPKSSFWIVFRLFWAFCCHLVLICSKKLTDEEIRLLQVSGNFIRKNHMERTSWSNILLRSFCAFSFAFFSSWNVVFAWLPCPKLLEHQITIHQWPFYLSQSFQFRSGSRHGGFETDRFHPSPRPRNWHITSTLPSDQSSHPHPIWTEFTHSCDCENYPRTRTEWYPSPTYWAPLSCANRVCW